MIYTDETPLNASIGNVTFAPGARNYWRSHKIGQVLLVTGGEGWYQEEGKSAQLLKTGDVIKMFRPIKTLARCDKRQLVCALSHFG